MAWFNPATWAVVDNIQNGMGGATEQFQQGASYVQPYSQPTSSGETLGASTDSAYNGSTYYDTNSGQMMEWVNGQYQPATASDDGSNPTTSTYKTGPTAEEQAAAQRKTQITNEINRLNSLLGVYGGQKETGFNTIDNDYNEKARLLAEQRTKANAGYDDQNVEATAGRTRGYELTDNYANNSANSLNRVFQGANAGNSSVARILAPHLVGKAADSRRLDVTTTANQNFGNIKKARDDTKTEFDYEDQGVENNRGYAKENFEKGLIDQESGLFNQRLALEQEAGQDTTGTQNELNTRTARLGQLFGAGKFNPQYQARAVAPKAVSLNEAKVDPMELKLGGQTQSGGGFYAPQLKKKQELRVR